jgi:hypothetical protein
MSHTENNGMSLLAFEARESAVFLIEVVNNLALA